MFYTIYKITNKENGKEYIGKHQTTNLNDGYIGSGKLIKAAIDKHGFENFRKQILHVFDTEEEMNRKESELVTEEYCARDDTYNLCPGGKGGWGYVNKNDMSNIGWKTNNSQEAIKRSKKGGESLRKKLIEDTFYRKKHINISKQNLRPNAFEGKTHSEKWKREHSELMKEKQSGTKNSQFGTMWITDGVNNKKIKKDLPLPKGWYRGRVKK